MAWELSDDAFDRLTQGSCAYCGVSPFAIARPSRNGEFVYNGIDRLDNRVGYIADNVVSCCRICNHAKRDMSVDQFTAWIARLIRHQILERVGSDERTSVVIEDGMVREDVVATDGASAEARA